MSQIPLSGGSQMKKIDLTALNLQQLTVLKQQLVQELDVFKDSLRTLKIAQSKFQESRSCLEQITPAIKDNEILVPLTGSMYVSGKLANTENVLVDIGTGYYAQKSIEDAKDYFNRRVVYVTEQMEKILQLGSEKSEVVDATVDVMEMKIQSQV